MINQKLKRAKFVIFLIIFACAMLIAGIAGICASFNVQTQGADISINYEPVGEVTLKTGNEINDLFEGCAGRSNIQSVTFDYYTAEIRNKIDGVDNVTDVTADLSGNINMYSVLDSSTNFYDVYILSDGQILANADCSYMFWNINVCVSITFNNFSTKNVTNMYGMFYGCYRLTSLDVTNFDTSKVIDMGNMFRTCSILTTLDLSNFNTSKVTDMGYMFYNCSSLTSLDLSSFDTSNVTDMGYMFDLCETLTELNLSNFNTSKVENMRSMFNSCYNLIKLDLTSFDTTSAQSSEDGFGWMFYDCESLIEVDLSSFNTYEVTTMNRMFSGCSNLKTIYVGDLWYVENVTNSDYMFAGCTSLVGGAGTTFSSSYTDQTYAYVDTLYKNGYLTGRMQIEKTGIELCGLMKGADADDPDEYYSSNSSVKTVIFDYDNDDYSTTIIKLNAKSSHALSTGAYDGIDYITLYRYLNSSGYYEIYILSSCEILAPTDCSYLFLYFTGLTEIQFNNFDTSKVTDMRSMFNGCSSLTDLDLSNFNTSKVTNMSFMFADSRYGDSFGEITYTAPKFIQLDLSSFDTSEVTDMTCMFRGCNVLKTIYVSNNWNTDNVTSSDYMFYDCNKLVGGNGTVFNSSDDDYVDYARIDTASTPGYLTLKM